MKRVLTLVLLFLMGFVYAQDFRTVLSKANRNMKEARELDMKISIHYTDPQGNKLPAASVSFLKRKDNFRQEDDTFLFLITEDAMLQINKAAQQILISRTESGKRPELWYDKSIYQIPDSVDLSDVVLLSDDEHGNAFSMSDSLGSKMELHFSKSPVFMETMKYTVSQQGQFYTMYIRFEDVKLNQKIPEHFFRLENYIQQKDGKWMGKGTYSHFEIIEK